MARWSATTMRRNESRIHGSSRLRRVLGLGLSGAALVGLVYFEGVSARAEDANALADDELEALADNELADEALVEEAEALEIAVPQAAGSEPAARPASARGSAAGGPAVESPAAVETPTTAVETPTAATPPVVLAMADVGAVEAAAAAMPTAPAPTLVAVPDLKGISLRKARRELKALGLKLSVRDEWGYKIDRDYWSDYRVRSQKIEAGTEIEPGSWVRIKARMRPEIAEGY